jgi:sugar phosphate isomerase/epimerase
MTDRVTNEIYFSFFMFTADLKPNDESYTNVLIGHLRHLQEIGYKGYDVHIASGPPGLSHEEEVKSYERLKRAFDKAGLRDAKFTTNVGTTRTFDPTSPFKEQRERAQAYLKSRVDITRVLGGNGSIMAGPFLYPYGVFPLTDNNEPLWSDALQDWLAQRYPPARVALQELGEYAEKKGIKLAIEPVKSWETPGPNHVSDTLDFLEGVTSKQVGVAVDTAQVVMESQGPEVFRRNIERAHRAGRLHYVHISAPDRGAVHDSWIPWNIVLPEIRPVYSGPLLIEVFNAVPPFDSSMRMSRRRFWRPGEDAPQDRPDAYAIATKAFAELERQLQTSASIHDSMRSAPTLTAP